MSNYYCRTVVENKYLGLSKVISAPSRSELQIKVANQQRIWREREQRERLRETKEATRSQAEALTELDTKRIQDYEDLIKNIAPGQKHTDYYDSLLQKDEFKAFTTELKKPTLAQVKLALGVPSESPLLEALFSKKKARRLEQEKLAEKTFNERWQKYSKNLTVERDAYVKEEKAFYSQQKKANAIIETARKKFEQGDATEIEKYFLYILNASRYPEDFLKDFELQYMGDTKTLVVSYTLPSEQDIPKITQHKFVASRNCIDEVKMSDRKFEQFYNRIVYMCSLRTIKEIFLSDDLDFVDNVIFNGWMRYIDKSTGNDARSCFITLDVDKAKFNTINLQNVDCKECIKGLKGLYAPSILSLTPVVPFLNINREDARFIESKEVDGVAIDGFNLATMPWEDFEYFIRELFDKLFNTDGGEVKVTQASRDGGVDAIAFDDDPIRGGKFVIQAKRYNNVVSVSAVRDLYGTMIHEGATKGILVTTSNYGKDAYNFAKDKPITLINGQELLGLLNKCGYSNLTIKTTKAPK